MEDKRGRHVYLHCKKNHSATPGTYAIDGCAEFVASDASPPSGGALLCSACCCHRSFHHKVPARYASPPLLPMAPLALVLMPLATEKQAVRRWRRVRTKFSTEQKERMGSFAERLGWRIPKREREEEELERFLEETGVSRRAFKVWMHNHRNAAAKVQAAQDPLATDTDNGAAAAAIAGVGEDGEAEDDGHGNAVAS